MKAPHRHFFPRTAARLVFMVLAGMLAAAAPALAGATDWAYSKGGKVRIVTAPPAADGSVRAAVVIDLKPGWTTYWRNPGESGVPPQLGIEGSTNVKSAELLFPPPTRLDEGGVAAIGYATSVAFPLSIRQAQPGRPSLLVADLFLGMCREICIPVSARYRLAIAPASAAKSPAAATQVTLAYAQLPEPESKAFGIESVVPSPDGKALLAKVRLPQPFSSDAPPKLFMAGPAGWSLGLPHLNTAEASTALFTVPIIAAPDGASASGMPVDVVVTDGARSMETDAVVR